MIKSCVVRTEDADIAYDIEGEGPLLLLIAGGNGDSKIFTKLSTYLSDRYTVVRYDRRADGRSTGDINGEMDMEQAGRDAAAVIKALNLGSAYVFGSSAGANIALELTAQHPELVKGLIAHEPPVVNILPENEASKWQALFHEVSKTFNTKGAAQAMALFGTCFIGFEQEAIRPTEHIAATHERFLAHEFVHINHYVPCIDVLRSSGVPIVMTAGRASGEAFYAKTAREVARQLSCTYVDIIGHHLGYRFQDALQFSEELDQIITIYLNHN
ncbi:alpha/beta fold hydrolase [Zophobihabitans entericus]|uniref:Alpha/beta hydrolase n=1 Tax=Zophobihabitans entericus TaxID=1635327 RepID=A0A6G9IAT8_9GAMM|nr:alpha/beta hydrolase [Zophobihabitans entericus]QIQ21341.1 alpha/beta hydrolase [Zophobihabitans entericus]